ncbi:MAG: hypothetical protein BWX73_02728 [Lentisphaerae bacterium ADurb.Bin082]|nr:MAG: hypothetical protein BWX73_02728 [Lentisphaerae bacterium ADurb.Bin082]
MQGLHGISDEGKYFLGWRHFSTSRYIRLTSSAAS